MLDLDDVVLEQGEEVARIFLVPGVDLGRPAGLLTGEDDALPQLAVLPLHQVLPLRAHDHRHRVRVAHLQLEAHVALDAQLAGRGLVQAAAQPVVLHFGVYPHGRLGVHVALHQVAVGALEHGPVAVLARGEHGEEVYAALREAQQEGHKGGVAVPLEDEPVERLAVLVKARRQHAVRHLDGVGEAQVEHHLVVVTHQVGLRVLLRGQPQLAGQRRRPVAVWQAREATEGLVGHVTTLDLEGAHVVVGVALVDVAGEDGEVVGADLGQAQIKDDLSLRRQVVDTVAVQRLRLRLEARVEGHGDRVAGPQHQLHAARVGLDDGGRAVGERQAVVEEARLDDGQAHEGVLGERVGEQLPLGVVRQVHVHVVLGVRQEEELVQLVLEVTHVVQVT